jgi:DNA polymerase III subunit delta'
MNWENIAGQVEVKQELKQSIVNDRISHAQIFYAPEGSGGLPLAIAYAKELLLSAKNNQNTASKVDHLMHSDLHFVFPTNSTDKIKSDKTESSLFLQDWRSFVKKKPYGNLGDWLSHIQIEKKQGIINVRDAESIINQMSLKSYEGGYKITIIWLAENMNTQAANKLLKIIEEPPINTVFILVTENLNEILPTILSRCQLVKINSLKKEEISEYLIDNCSIENKIAEKIATLSHGNLNKALKIANDSEQNQEFEEFFVLWVRNAFIAKTNITALQGLINWTNDINAWGREKQKSFLVFCIEIFREALMSNYQITDQPYYFQKAKIDWSKFSAYIHGANIEDILNELNKAHYHIERNINAKLVFLDSSIKITRYLHQKMN